MRMTKGAVTTPEDPFDSSHVRSHYDEQFPEETYTFFNDGENPATIYLFRISPVFRVLLSASPLLARTLQPLEEPAGHPGLPAEFGVAPLSTWDQMEFSLVKVEPG